MAKRLYLPSRSTSPRCVGRMMRMPAKKMTTTTTMLAKIGFTSVSLVYGSSRDIGSPGFIVAHVRRYIYVGRISCQYSRSPHHQLPLSRASGRGEGVRAQRNQPDASTERPNMRRNSCCSLHPTRAALGLFDRQHPGQLTDY